MSRESLRFERRILSPEHPSTWMTVFNLAVALKGQGKYADAETMFNETLLIQQRVLGPEHPRTVWTACDLAACIRSARDTADSAK